MHMTTEQWTHILQTHTTTEHTSCKHTQLNTHPANTRNNWSHILQTHTATEHTSCKRTRQLNTHPANAHDNWTHILQMHTTTEHTSCKRTRQLNSEHTSCKRTRQLNTHPGNTHNWTHILQTHATTEHTSCKHTQLNTHPLHTQKCIYNQQETLCIKLYSRKIIKIFSNINLQYADIGVNCQSSYNIIKWFISYTKLVHRHTHIIIIIIIKPGRFTRKTRLWQPRRATTRDGATNTHTCQYYKHQSNQFMIIV